MRIIEATISILLFVAIFPKIVITILKGKYSFKGICSKRSEMPGLNENNNKTIIAFLLSQMMDAVVNRNQYRDIKNKTVVDG